MPVDRLVVFLETLNAVRWRSENCNLSTSYGKTLAWAT